MDARSEASSTFSDTAYARQVAVQGQQFAFDHVFAPDLSQESVYEQLKIDDMVEGAALPEIVVREARDGTVHIEGARCVVVSSAADALRHVRTAASQRTIGSTAMNATSSRSHAVFTLSISVCARVPATGAVRKSTAELVFVDLAGSEGCKRTGAEGERQREAISINLGLHHLTRVMHELVVQQRDRRSSGSHINYRSSKLTRLLQNALGGNSTTLIVACVSPRASDSTETIETLKYAERARKIKTRPLPNVTVASDPEKHGALVSQLTAELAQRDALLESARADLEFALAEQRAALEAGFERERAALAAAREELAAERSQLVARVEDEAAARHARELERLRTEHALEIHAERSARRCSASPSEALRLCTGQMPAAGLLRENKAVQAQLHCGGGCVKEGQLSAELDVGSVLRVLQSVLADDSVDGQSDGERSEGTCTNTMLSRTGTCLELDRTSDVGQ